MADAGAQVGNEVGTSDPVFMKKHGEEMKTDSGKWIDSAVWHGKAHTWDKMPWLIREVRPAVSYRIYTAGRPAHDTPGICSGNASRADGRS